MARKTKYDFYGDQFKATAVELGALPGVKATDVAKILDSSNHAISLEKRI